MCRVELGGALERIGQLAKEFAYRGRAGRQRAKRGMAPWQVTERSPRILSVASALTWPAFGMPTIMPNCCATAGSDAVGSMRPNSSGGPLYLSRSGRIMDALTVWVGKRSGVPARTAPVAGATGRPSSVTSALATPLKARTRSR
jgi:hypothetical protein